MDNLWTGLVASLGLSVVGAVGAAYLFFQFLGKKWIEQWLASQLERARHEHAVELARLRVQIDSALSGALKLQQRDFETMIEAWGKLDEAYGQVTAMLSSIQRSVDLDGMNANEVEQFLENSRLSNTQRDKVRSARDKNRAYEAEIFWHKLRDVQVAGFELHRYVIRHGILFPADLKDKFTKVSNELWSATAELEISHEAADFRMQREAWKKIETDVAPVIKTIGTEIHARLHSHARLDGGPECAARPA